MSRQPVNASVQGPKGGVEGYLDKVFRLTENGTSVSIEARAGLTTFMTMVYILAVNPNILSAAGMDRGAVFTATALSAAVGTLLMAWVARYPFALAPGMGLNAYFAFTVVVGWGYSWQFALTAVLVEGIIFIILSVLKVREKIFNSVPKSLRNAISVGIGLFIAFIGLQNSKIVVPNASTGVSFFNFGTNPFRSVGITVVLAIVGIMITGVLMHRRVKGGMLWGIILTWAIGMVCQLFGMYIPDAELGMYSLFPDFSAGFAIPSMRPTFWQFEWSQIFSLDFWVVTLSFLYVDMFDTMGTLIGVANEAGMLDEHGRLPRIKQAFLSDAIATVVGAIFGTSTTTTYVESASGVAEGGRTGLTSTVTGLLFAASLVLSPIFLAIPSFATAPALIVVGCMMLKAVTRLDTSDWTEWLPAAICIFVMPFAYSISDGICWGFISYAVINTLTGKASKVSPMMYVMSLLFILKYALL